MIPAILFVAIYGLVSFVALGSLFQIRQFLATTPMIADEASLERYRHLVRIQMYLALFVMAALFFGIVVGMWVIARHGCAGFSAVLAANIWIFAAGLYHKSWENRARRLEASSEALAQEHKRITDVWLKKALPDF